MNWFAPAPEGLRECDADPAVEDSSSARSGSSLWVGEAGTLALGGVWKGMSVGEMYLREADGPAPVRESDSSSIGVIGGGGVDGGEGEVMGLPRRGEDSTGADDDNPDLGRRER